MPSQSIKLRAAIGALGALGTICLAAAQPAVAFGDVGFLTPCTSFTTCTAGVASGASYQARRDVVASPSYPLGSFLQQGATVYQDSVQTQGGQAIDVNNYPPPVPPPIIGPWAVFARAQAQSDFGALHALARTSRAALGVDTIVGLGTAQIGQQTFAEASAAWRDVWSFSAPGTFSASASADGGSALAAFDTAFPSTYAFNGRPLLADWFFDVRVWDVTNQTVSIDFETGGPTLVARANPRGNNEQRHSFNDSLVLSFAFVPGVQYVVTAELRTTALNGRELNLLNTGRLIGAVVGGGATLTTASGHDYVSAVPESDVRGMLLAGVVAVLVLAGRRRSVQR